jgi:NADH dehydrogenase
LTAARRGGILGRVADTGVDIVTGAFSYTGKYIARRLLDAGRTVRTLTRHPDRPDPFGGRVEPLPYRFDDPAALARSLEGATALYNTYWVRFARGDITFAGAVANSIMLFAAARSAGIERIVHVSITNPSAASPLPYFAGKAAVERALAGSGVSYAIVRPTLVFGREDVLVNNIAWVLRRFPVFTVPGSGRYRLQPVHVDDVAGLCVEAAGRSGDETVDAAGPEVFTFDELVRLLRATVGSRARIVHIPPPVALAFSRLPGLLVGDVVLTGDELQGLMAELLVSSEPATGRTRLSEWAAEHARELGSAYASELGRHFR